MEKWLPINGFPNYSISDEGRVKNNKTGRVLKHGTNQKGYHNVSLYNNGSSCTKKIHKLVADAFCDGKRPGLEINHIDGDKNNNSKSNLEWCTGSRNIQHSYDNNLRKPPRMKKVMVVETGEVFDSLSDCARKIGGTVSGVWDCIDGRQRTHRNYHFEEV